MKELVENPEAWNGVAADYNLGARQRLRPFSEAAVEWAALRETDAVLDVACGPGTTTLLAAARAGSVHAVDFASEMIAQLRVNASELDNVTSEVGDGQKLRLENSRFDAAFSMFGLMFFPDPVAGLRELHRVLKPGGRVLISSWVPMEESPMIRVLVGALMRADPPPPDAPKPEPFAFQSEDALAEGLRAGGFEDVQVRRLEPEVAFDGPEGYWEEAKTSLFAKHKRKERGDAWPEIEAKVLEALRESLGDARALRMPGFIARGVKKP